VSAEINFDDFEGTLNPRGFPESPVNLPPRRLRIYVYRKGVAYPFSFVGSSIHLLSKTLDISQKAASLLLIAKINEVLRSVEDTGIRNGLQQRVKRLQTNLDPIKPRKCVHCGHLFSSKRRLQQRCPRCLSQGSN
jgi:predicted Zn-ribbon and HTH transcriptional regulator